MPNSNPSKGGSLKHFVFEINNNSNNNLIKMNKNDELSEFSKHKSKNGNKFEQNILDLDKKLEFPEIMKQNLSSSTAIESERKLVGLSIKKRYYSPNFFTWGNPSDHNTQIFRQKRIDPTENLSNLKAKTFVPPEFKGKHDPQQLPAFLRERLNINNSAGAKEERNYFDGFCLSPSKGEAGKERSQSLEGNCIKNASSAALSNRKRVISGQEIKSNIEEILAKEAARVSAKKYETIDYQYLSPKARHQVKEEKFPILLSNVFLTGMVNPVGVSPREEATVEHIISEHHSKVLKASETFAQLSIDDRKKKSWHKSSIALNLVEQNKRKGRMMELIPRDPKDNILGRVETHMVAAIDQLKLERENRRKKMVKMLCTKKFNSFRPFTIKNMHLLKDAFKK